MNFFIKKYRRDGVAQFSRKSFFYLYFYIYYLIIRLINIRNLKSMNVYCYPDIPTRPYSIWKCFMLLGLKAVSDPSLPRKIMYRHEPDTDKLTVDPNVEGSGLGINGHCTYAGKDRVQRVFSEIFKYDLKVNPLTYNGPVVKKSIANAVHDGIILNGPIEKPMDNKYVYEILVNNQIDNYHVVDYRVAIVNFAIPFVWKKIRKTKSRFSNLNERIEMVNENDIFTNNEIRKIIRFSQSMGLWYGELDVLRCRETNKIYIVDANKTPHGPPAMKENYEGIRAMKLLASAVKYHFFYDPRED